MKGLIVSSLSLLFLSTISTSAVRAEQTAFNPAVSGKTPAYVTQITPVNLVNMAYQGQLENQGIPSYNDLRVAYLEKQITAEDIVQSAIKAKILPSQVLADKEYLSAVATQLDTFRTY